MTHDQLVADVGFEIIYGGDRFDAFDIRNIVDDNNFDVDKLKKDTKEWVRQHWPKEISDMNTEFVNMEINHWYGK